MDCSHLNVKNKISFLIYVTIGSFGAIGQAIWLRHDLIDTYSFKMMGPLTPLYFQIGKVGAIISPAVAIALIFMFRSVRKSWLPAVPVVAYPLIFWLVFESLVWQSSYSAAEMARPQFNRNTGESMRWVFLQACFAFSGAGLFDWPRVWQIDLAG